ncbi:MAG: TPM domain-containing protein [Bacteroidetes bacterium]|nr:TPM domain-containing protein [Bacteroidota bacterium]
MNKLLITLGFLLLPLAGLLAQDVPAKPDPPRLVNDLAHVMTADQTAALERKLVDYDDSTSVQIAIVTVPDIGDYAIEDYALKLFRTWGIGNKKNNNGVLVLVDLHSRKIYIQTGLGLEGAIPDVTAKSIIDNEMVPNFKGGGNDNFYRGFSLAADALIKAAAGEYKAPEGYSQRGQRGRHGGGNVIGILVFIIILIIVFISRNRGGGGGGGGLYRGSGILPFMIGTMIGRGFRDSGGGWGGGGGGGWSGGGGGGFGGFGGGNTGGGGASGSW